MPKPSSSARFPRCDGKTISPSVNAANLHESDSYPPVERFELGRRHLPFEGHLRIEVEVQRELGNSSKVVGLQHGKVVKLGGR